MTSLLGCVFLRSVHPQYSTFRGSIICYGVAFNAIFAYSAWSDCIFCEILNGNIKTAGIFREDEEFMAFLSTWPSVE